MATDRTLRARVLALELRKPQRADPGEETMRLKAWASALFDALDRGSAPGVSVDHLQQAEAWLARIEAGTETDADRAAAAGFPPWQGRSIDEQLRICIETLSMPQTDADALIAAANWGR